MGECTASLIVIGDEILRGQIVDTNTSYLARTLRSNGIGLSKVTIVPDVVDEIAKEVHEASKSYATVFTCGGVGPTHDDVTYEAVSKALALELGLHQDLVNLYSSLMPGNDKVKRLAIVPQPCEIVRIDSADTIRYAVIKAKNVYVLPGSPKYFTPAVDVIVSRLKGNIPLHFEYIDVKLDELSIVNILDSVAKQWENKVSIGSYPQAEPTPVTRITFEGSKEDVMRAKEELLASLSDIKMEDTGKMFTLANAYEIIESSNKNSHIKESLNILEECLNKYKSNEVFISFNGGKDCTVILHLVATVVKVRKIPPLLCLYVTNDPFPEVETFVKEATRYYGLELIRKEGSMRSALTSLLEERSDLKASIMGLRKGDPGSDNLEPFMATDEGWPRLMRVNPILNWMYDQVWEFLLKHKVPYCSLYDKGYTSIGTRANTVPNPLLKDPQNSSSYLPAYTLADKYAERQGRR